MIENQRFKEVFVFLKENKYVRNQQDFTERIGSNKSTISQIMNNRIRIPNNLFANINAAFPRINPHWLRTGEGEMLKDEENFNAEFIGFAAPALQEQLQPVRFFDLKPSASFREFCDPGHVETDFINILPDHNETFSADNCVFQVHGDSMEPQIHSGTKVLCEEINPTRWHSVQGVIVIAYADRFVIKRIIKNRLVQNNYLLLGSDNPDFPEQEYAQLCDIRCIFRAVRLLSQPIS